MAGFVSRTQFVYSVFVAKVSVMLTGLRLLGAKFSSVMLVVVSVIYNRLCVWCDLVMVMLSGLRNLRAMVTLTGTCLTVRQNDMPTSVTVSLHVTI